MSQDWSKIRDIRNELLSECDWTQLADAPLSDIKKGEWTTYRQALRDVTTQEIDAEEVVPHLVSFPTKPE